MKPNKLTFAISILAIFGFATMLISLITNEGEKSDAPIFKAETEKTERFSVKPQEEVEFRVSDRADVNLRECPGVNCKAIAILRRGGLVHLSGLRKLVPNSVGAAIPWVEVASLSEYCTKLAPGEKVECLEWGGGNSYSGWVNELYIQTK